MSFFVTSCGIDNRSNETSVETASSIAVKNFAATLDLPSGMAGVSGEILIEKLVQLFPFAELPIAGKYYTNHLGRDNVWAYKYSFNDPLTVAIMKKLVNPHFISVKELFSENSIQPDFNYQTNFNYRLATFKNTEYYPSFSTLGSAERSTSPLVILQSKILFDTLCSGKAGDLDKISTLFNADSVRGESFSNTPDGSAARTALIVARNAWHYPYKQNDPEVLGLKNIILNKVYADASVTEQKEMLCLASVLSHPFMIGNALKGDVLNRISLALTQRYPSLEEIERYNNGSLTLREFVTNLQRTPEYLDTVQRWHGARLGFGTFNYKFTQLRTVLDGDSSGSFAQKPYYHLNADFGDPKGTHPESVVSVGVQNDVEPCAPSFDESVSIRYRDGTVQTSDGKIVQVQTALQTIRVLDDKTFKTLSIKDAEFNEIKGNDAWMASYYVKSNGVGNPNRNQGFDPRTTMMLWQQYNPVSNKYEVLAGWVLKPFLSQYRTASGITAAVKSDHELCEVYTPDPRWLKCKGAVTLQDGSKKYGITLGDIQFKGLGEVNHTYDGVFNNTYDGAVFKSGSNLIGTPLDPILRENNSNKGNYVIDDRPIVSYGQGGTYTLQLARYSPPTTENPTGRNDQFSTIQDYHSGKPLLSCNSMMRFVLTCSYVPPKNRIDLQALGSLSTKSMLYAIRPPNSWNPSMIMPTHDRYRNVPAFSFAHPEIIRHFRCGNINQIVLAQSGGATTNLDAAMPFGYEPLPPYDASNYNESTNPQIPASWLASPSVNHIPKQTDLNQVATQHFYNLHPFGDKQPLPRDSVEQWSDFVNIGLEQEPYRLIEDIIKTGDYSRLVTADYTYANKALELYYRTQGYPLSVRPPGYVPPADGDLSAVVKLAFDTMGTIPKRMVKFGDTATADGWKTMRPPAAGILRMPALWSNLSSASPRTAAARIFVRLLCGQPNLYDPATDGATDLHLTEFKRMKETTLNSKEAGTIQDFVDSHLSDPGGLKQDCMQCHQNLDPLGMAMFKWYGSLLARGLKIGNLGGMDTELGSIGTVSGLTSGPVGVFTSSDDKATSAFLGRQVNGFTDIGKTLSESRLFYSCAAESEFNNIFGRLPSQIEARKAFKNVVDDFMAKKDYNEMIYRLAEIQEKLNGE